MTGIDLIISMMFAACVNYEGPEHVISEEKYTSTLYVCPLIGNNAEFVVWHHICENGKKDSILFVDLRSRRGYTIDRFGSVMPAYVDVSKQDIYFPVCVDKEEEIK